MIGKINAGVNTGLSFKAITKLRSKTWEKATEEALKWADSKIENAPVLVIGNSNFYAIMNDKTDERPWGKNHLQDFSEFAAKKRKYPVQIANNQKLVDEYIQEKRNSRDRIENDD